MTEPLLKAELSRHTPVISIDLLSADFMNLSDDLQLLEEAGQMLLHVDISDGSISPNITMGSTILQKIKTTLFKEIHLQIHNPGSKIFQYCSAGADIVILPLTLTENLYKVLYEIAHLENKNDPSRGILKGISIYPETPLGFIIPLLPLTDIIYLHCGVHNFTGEFFLPDQKQRFLQIKNMVKTSNRSILCGIMGAISKRTLPQIIDWGPDLIVLGGAIFESEKIKLNLKEISEILHSIGH